MHSSPTNSDRGSQVFGNESAISAATRGRLLLAHSDSETVVSNGRSFKWSYSSLFKGPSSNWCVRIVMNEDIFEPTSQQVFRLSSSRFQNAESTVKSQPLLRICGSRAVS